MRNLLFFILLSCTNSLWAQNEKYDTSKFMFIENTKSFNTIEDVLKLKQFKNKIVYIDLWGYGCAACMKEFDYLPEIKAKYKNSQVAYLYIYYKFADSVSTDIKNNYWIKYSIDKQLYGTHLLASIQPIQTINNAHVPTIRETQTITLDKDIYAIPRYMLADQTGKIKIFDAPRPNEKEKLFALINQLLTL